MKHSCWPRGGGLGGWHASLFRPAIKSHQPPRGKRVVNQAETGPIKSSNRCRDWPGSAGLSDRGLGSIWKSCHLINIQNTCRSDAAHFAAVTMVLLADAVSNHEQRQRQAERQRVEERTVLGQDQRNGMKRISIRAANTTPREDNTPQV